MVVVVDWRLIDSVNVGVDVIYCRVFMCGMLVVNGSVVMLVE